MASRMPRKQKKKQNKKKSKKKERKRAYGRKRDRSSSAHWPDGAADKLDSVARQSRPTIPNSVYATLGSEVYEHMLRLGGQSNVKPAVLSFQASLVLI
ncbi:hypothetical protein TNCV_3073231 [Trichonephila clavipes]|nr:hypothetical protein TNCV_3073231 [Trichonephila clavipes]